MKSPKLIFIIEISKNMASYTGQVATIHRQFNAALKGAKSRQAVLNAYWKHKAQHEKLLKQHLKQEMAQVNRVKSKIKYR
tara:strand:- start:334 stop:573 length:240 start_codon:yes stop_codon:yes gene_type:complete